MQVVALIHEGNGEFAATFPDFPGAIAVADTMDAVIAGAAGVLARHAEAMIEEGLDLPPVRSLSQLSEDARFRDDAAGAMMALVSFAPPAAMVRLAVAIDETLLARADEAARAAGETRSAYVAEALRRRLALQAQPPAAQDVRELMESIKHSIAAIDAAPGDQPTSRSARRAAP
jgi:predicted RNase H-like HicB family nuclease